MNNIGLSPARIQEIADLNTRLEHIQKCAAVMQIALARMLTMHEMVMNKTNIKASFYDADCIREMNEAPVQARRVLLDMKDGAA
ncbi:hypothetical protein [Salmonella enterica]|uniref:hypothetical protein n=1 Tax=Salmonella enterica TaxID=28901 RepID=UPI003D312123